MWICIFEYGKAFVKFCDIVKYLNFFTFLFYYFMGENNYITLPDILIWNLTRALLFNLSFEFVLHAYILELVEIQLGCRFFWNFTEHHSNINSTGDV
jgi:hypothetical protein